MGQSSYLNFKSLVFILRNFVGYILCILEVMGASFRET